MSFIRETSESEMQSETVTFGRTLVDGTPVDDGVTLPIDSPAVELLAGASSPLVSNPVVGEYGVALVRPEEVDGEYMRGLLIAPPGAAGPPKHFHPNYEESFEVIEGEFVFEVGEASRTVRAGETLTIDPGTPHKFSNRSDENAAFVVEARPASRLVDVVQLLFGLAHDGKLRDSGQPRFLQAMVMADEMGEDTVFTSPPPVVQRVLAAIFGPLGRLAGYRAVYPEYGDEAFWEARVEQLSLPEESGDSTV